MECPSVECGQSDGATGALDKKKTEVTVSDRTLASVGPACPVRCSNEDAGVGQTIERWVALRPDAERLRPVMLSVSTVRSHSVTGRWQGPVEHDRTCPVG